MRSNMLESCSNPYVLYKQKKHQSTALLAPYEENLPVTSGPPHEALLMLK